MTDTTTNELDLEIIKEAELYPFAESNRQMRRAFIFEQFNWNPDIDGNIQIKQLEQIDQWLCR